METTTNTNAVDCGHVPIPTECTPGTAHTSDGRTICHACAEAAEVAAFAKADRYFAYLTRDKATGRLVITTWTGRVLAEVTSANVAPLRGTFGGYRQTRTYIRAVAPDGSRWYGTSPGEGMYCRVRRAVAS